MPSQDMSYLKLKDGKQLSCQMHVWASETYETISMSITPSLSDFYDVIMKQETEIKT